MDAIGLILLLLVAGFVFGHVQRVRGASAGRTSHWKITSALPPDELDRIIVSALKGHSPIARVHGSLADGSYQRRVLRWAAQATSTATAQVEVHRGPANAEGACQMWTVSASISDWEIEHIGGMAHPVMSAPLAARRRLRGLIEAILEADSSATVLGEAT